MTVAQAVARTGKQKQAIAELMGTSPSQVSMWCNGRAMTVRNALKFAKLVGLDVGAMEQIDWS